MRGGVTGREGVSGLQVGVAACGVHVPPPGVASRGALHVGVGVQLGGVGMSGRGALGVSGDALRVVTRMSLWYVILLPTVLPRWSGSPRRRALRSSVVLRVGRRWADLGRPLAI